MSTKFNVGIIDDDPSFLKQVEADLNVLPKFDLAFLHTSPLEACKQIKKNPPDILLTDIAMPEYHGLALLEDLKPYKIPTVAMSAYKTFAYETLLELKVADFLYKPFSVNRLAKALKKASKLLPKAPESQKVKSIFLTSGNAGLIKINTKDIFYFQGGKDYTEICTENSRYYSRESLVFYQELLGNKGFLRVHKSFVINIKKLSATTSSEIKLINQIKIPCSRHYAENLKNALKNKVK